MIQSTSTWTGRQGCGWQKITWEWQEARKEAKPLSTPVYPSTWPSRKGWSEELLSGRLGKGFYGPPSPIDIHPTISNLSSLFLIYSSVLLLFKLSHIWLFCNTMTCSQLDSSVHGISQARILEWVAISFSRGSSWPRDWTRVFCFGRWILYHWAIGGAPFQSISAEEKIRRSQFVFILSSLS